MEICILIAFLAVAAICFVFIARLDKSDIYADSRKELHIAAQDIYAASWIYAVSEEFQQVKLTPLFGTAEEIFSAICEGRADMGIVREKPDNILLSAEIVEIKPSEILIGESGFSAQPLSDKPQEYYLVYLSEAFDSEIAEIISLLKQKSVAKL